MTKSQPQLFPDLQRVRVTVPVTPDTLELFKRLASVQGTSVGKAMGDWLTDTADGVHSLIPILIDARRSPLDAARRLNSLALGLSDFTTSVLEDVRQKSKKPAATQGASLAGKVSRTAKGTLSPPVSNTGGKVSSRSKPKVSK
jgi:hypothetical protein